VTGDAAAVLDPVRGPVGAAQHLLDCRVRERGGKPGEGGIVGVALQDEAGRVKIARRMNSAGHGGHW